MRFLLKNYPMSGLAEKEYEADFASAEEAQEEQSNEWIRQGEFTEMASGNDLAPVPLVVCLGE